MSGLAKYVQESYHELVHKVSWPSWKDLQNSSLVVLIAALIVSLIIFAMDWVFGVQNAGSTTGAWRGMLGYIYELFK